MYKRILPCLATNHLKNCAVPFSWLDGNMGNLAGIFAKLSRDTDIGL